jgi:hypothetical protein
MADESSSLEQVVKDAQARVENQSKIAINANANTTVTALTVDPGLKTINTYGNQPGKLQPPNN